MSELTTVEDEGPLEDEAGVVVALDPAAATEAVTSPEAAPSRVLVVVAHPDDVDFGAAGTIAAWTALGARVSYCIVTDGAAGSFDPGVDLATLAEMRQKEQRAAARAVGVEEVVFLGEPDGKLEPTLSVRREISRVIRQVRPDRVITQSPERNFERIRVDAFAAGLFCFSIASEEVICIPRPSLWIADGQLHRADGPAVAWSSGEAHYFWRGTAVPSWVIEEPERITPQTIDSESNVELRRCLIERFGHERYLRVRGAVIVHEDQYGRLWRLEIPNREPSTMVEVENGTTDPDGTRRRYFLRVPPSMRSAREAVAWTYGLPPEQYKVAART